jgi:alanine dehydrogenase
MFCLNQKAVVEFYSRESPGVSPGRVVVIGGGIAGLNSAVIAMGMGAEVAVIDRSAQRLAQIDQVYNGRIKTLMSSTASIQKSIYEADLVIGAVLIPGARAPKLVTNADVCQDEAWFGTCRYCNRPRWLL